MKFLKALAFPLAIIYGIITWLRNKLYDLGIFRSHEFPLTVISVGNLAVGGTGKSPHIEYLVRLLKSRYRIATLSRGYGRSSSGFIEAGEASTAADIGDEPLQFSKKFGGEVVVAVDRKRVHGIKKLLELHPALEVILLDDAFQHRAVRPGLSIVLTDYNNIYLNDHVLPTGTLREFKKGIKRADIIMVTKTPAAFSPIEKRRLLKEINARPYQQVYFSSIAYGPLMSLKKTAVMDSPDHDMTVVLLTGIANPRPLEEHLSRYTKSIVPVRFPDHHEYSATDLARLQKIFDNIATGKKIILTTEKDAMRLQKPELAEALENLPVFYIPIEVRFEEKDAEEFDKQILDHVRANPYNHRIHSKKGELHA